MKLRVSSVLGTAAAALLASAALPVAAAVADTGPSVDAFASTPGPDAFTIGGYELDPYLGTPGFTTGEGFTVPPEITGTPPYFETGSVSPQVFEVFSPATSSNPAVELGAFSGGENVTTLGSITNTGFSVGQLIPTNANGILGLPQYGTVFDVTNFGNGVENEYINIPATNLTSGSITDTLVTPYGDYDLSNMFSDTHIVNLNPGAAFGISPDAAPPSTVDGFASAPGPDAFTLGGYEFDPYLGTPGAIAFEEFNLPSDITGTRRISRPAASSLRSSKCSARPPVPPRRPSSARSSPTKTSAPTATSPTPDSPSPSNFPSETTAAPYRQPERCMTSPISVTASKTNTSTSPQPI